MLRILLQVRLRSQTPSRSLLLGPGSEKKRYGTYSDKPDDNWDRAAEIMMLQLQTESGHPKIRASNFFERGELRSKEHGKKSIHFNGSEENIELLLRTVISANQLSVHGAIADLCMELSEEAPDHLETMEILTNPSIAGSHTNEQPQGNLVQDYERTFEHLSGDQKLSKLSSDSGLKIVELGQYFFTLDTKERNEMQHLCREYVRETETS